MNTLQSRTIPVLNSAFASKILAMFAKEVERIVAFDFFSEEGDRILSDADIQEINRLLHFQDRRLSFSRKTNYPLSHYNRFPVYTASRDLTLP